MKFSGKIFFGILRTAVAVGLLTYLTVSGAIHWQIILQLISNWPITLLALLVCVLFSFVQAQRLSLLFWAQDMSLHLYASFKLTLIGLFFNSCLPGATGGDAIKIYYAIEGNEGRRAEIATLIMFDRVIGMLGLLILPILAAPLFPIFYGEIETLRSLVWGSACVFLLVAGGILLCFIRGLKDSLWVQWVFKRLPLGNYLKRVLDTLYSYRYKKGTLLTVVGISVLGHAMNIAIILLLAMVLNPIVLRWEVSLLIPFGFLAMTLPISPGGIGVGEAAFAKLFALVGLSGGADLLLGWRFLSLLVGLGGLFFYFEGRKRFVQDSGSVRVPGGSLHSEGNN